MRKVGVLTDRPPGTPSPITQDQDVVNTVGPVPMTFGYGPNTFPHSAAHVLDANKSPSRSEGEPIKTTYASAANHNLPSLCGGDSNNYMSRITHFSGSNLTPISERGVSTIYNGVKNLLFT